MQGRWIEAEHFIADLAAGGETLCRAALNISVPKHAPGHLEITGLPLLEPGEDAIVLGARLWSGLSVRGVLKDRRLIVLEKPALKRFGAAGVSLVADGFTVSDEGISSSNWHGYHATISLSPAPVLMMVHGCMMNTLGTIEMEVQIGRPRKLDDGISWRGRLGTYVGADFYEWESTPNEDILTRVMVPQITTSGTVPVGLSIEALIDAIDKDIEGPLRLLSLLSRRVVVWYEITISLLPVNTDEDWVRVVRRRRSTDIPPLVQGQSSLVHNSQLSEGQFARLVEELDRSPLRECVIRASIHLVASFHQPYVESRLGLLYLAIETLNSGFAAANGTERILPGQTHDDFLSELAAAVRVFSDKNGVEPAVRDQLEANVRALGRSSLKQGLRRLIQQTGITTADLWPGNANLARELQQVVQRRNELIHLGQHASDLAAPVADAMRLQAIAERAILRLLGWDQPDWRVAYEDFSWLRQH
jgi:hypothetical protein